MNLVTNVPAWSILFLIICGVLTAALPAKIAKWISSCAMAIVCAINVWLLTWFLSGNDSFTYSMGHYGAPFGNELRAGTLEAAAAVVFCFVALISVMGGRKHIEEDIRGRKQNLYYISVVFLLCSMLALTYTNDLFTAYVFIEINTITACGIIFAKEDRRALAASARYLIMSLVGSGLFLLGICIMYGETGHLLMEPIREYVLNLEPGSNGLAAVQIATALFVVGMALKSALFPFHSWLPEAHSSATASSSALLSGLVLKAYIFTIIKVVYRVLGIKLMSGNPVFDVLFVFGALAMVMGSVLAIREKDLKRMLAYSSVGQIGYIYLALGMGTEAGVQAAFIQIIAHAATKAMLFVASGGIMDVSGGSKKFKDIEGAGRRDPFAGAAFFVGSLSMIGIPLFAGFATKYMLVDAATGLPSWKMILSIAAIVISTLLTAIYYIMAMMVIFKEPDSAKKEKASLPKESKAAAVSAEGTLCAERRFHWEYVAAIVIFIALNFAVGINMQWLFDLAAKGFAMFA